MKRKPFTKKRARWERYVAAAAVLFVVSVASFAVGQFVAPRPVRCVENEHAMGTYRNGNVLQKFRLEDCEDGSKRMVPDGYIPLKPDGPTPDMEPDSHGQDL